MSEVRAVIFDLDGVIIDSEPVWEDVRRRFVAERGGQWLPDSQERLMGMSTTEWADYLAAEVGVPMSPAEIAAGVIDRMVQRYDAALPLIPGAVEAVRRLQQHWPLGLASSSPRRLIDAVLTAAGLGDAFGVTLSTEEVARGKPSPDVYLEVAGRMGVDPADAVAIEDSSNGLRAAIAAGMRAVAAERPEYPIDTEIKSRAAYTASGPEELTVDRIGRL
jgi:HAD superfamily hydrolase (TIGR01509 family)